MRQARVPPNMGPVKVAGTSTRWPPFTVRPLSCTLVVASEGQPPRSGHKARTARFRLDVGILAADTSRESRLFRWSRSTHSFGIGTTPSLRILGGLPHVESCHDAAI